MSEIVPAADGRNAFVVVNGETEQSFVDLSDPLRLEFEYVQRIAEVLDETVLARQRTQALRVVHVGGGGLTLPRYVQARRPGTAQIVFEPDADLTERVRRELPFAGRVTTKIRAVDGRTGLAEMPSGCADAVVVDAFAGASVPGELATRLFFADGMRLLRDEGVLVMNVTDSAPFAWSKRCIAGIVANAAQVAVIAEVPILKGRRFGNLIVVGGAVLPLEALSDRLRQAAFPHRLLAGVTLRDWLGGAFPFEATDAQPSPEPNWSKTWFSTPQRHR